MRWVVNAISRPLYSHPPKDTQYTLYRRLGGPESWCGWEVEILPPEVSNPRPSSTQQVPTPTKGSTY